MTETARSIATDDRPADADGPPPAPDAGDRGPAPEPEAMTDAEWIRAHAAERGADLYEALGDRHHAMLVMGKPTLIVSFETLEEVRLSTIEPALSGAERSIADLAAAQGWSHLRLMSDGETWFRADGVHDFVDGLIDGDFFESFDQVLFYGARACGYAACAFSVAAPGSRVLAFAPRATGDPRATSWDPRLRRMRSADFTSRYGYAPRMLDAAAEAFVVVDPREPLDAMHAALLDREATTVLRTPYLGEDPDGPLKDYGIWRPLVIAAATGSLDRDHFAELWRQRHQHRDYAWTLIDAVEDSGRAQGRERKLLIAMVAHGFCKDRRAPRFRRLWSQLATELGLDP